MVSSDDETYANDGLGSYVLYTHMMKQRRKVMRNLKEDPAKKRR